MALQRDALAAVGLLDERFFIYCEEDDWCLRARKQGWRIVYHPRACVTHYGGASTEQARSSAPIHLYTSRKLYLRKHFGWAAALLYKVAVLGKSLVGLVWAVLRRLLRRTSVGTPDAYVALLKQVLRY